MKNESFCAFLCLFVAGKLLHRFWLRDVDGIKQPFLIHWSFPGRVWGRKVDEIKQNVPLDDAKFNPLVSRP